MRHLIRNLRKQSSNSLTLQETAFLRAIGKSGYPEILFRHFSDDSKHKTTDDNLVKYTQIARVTEEEIKKMKETLETDLRPHSFRVKEGKITIKDNKSEVFQPISRDLESINSRHKKIILASSDDINIRYGEPGKSTSLEKSPEDLLSRDFHIPGGYFGIIGIKLDAPFQIINDNRAVIFATPLIGNYFTKVTPYNRNDVLKKSSLDVMVTLHENVARIITLKLQEEIFGNIKKQKFYEETTVVVDEPSEFNTNSGTLLNFEVTRSEGSNSTASHYHSGDRKLIVFTIGKEAGAILNFCGPNESPEDRKDCEVIWKFPPNSICVLKFPTRTHHKFFGDFVAYSDHTEDGPNIRDAEKFGQQPELGFLEKNTSFSLESQKKVENIINSISPNPKGFYRKDTDKSDWIIENGEEILSEQPVKNNKSR